MRKSRVIHLRHRPITIASVLISRRNGVVPFWMEPIAGYVEGRHLLVGDFQAFRVGVAVEFAADRETGFRRGVRYQFDGDQHVGERRSAPVLGDVTEHSVLDLVPLRRTRWIMADLNGQTGFIGELLVSVRSFFDGLSRTPFDGLFVGWGDRSPEAIEPAVVLAAVKDASRRWRGGPKTGHPGPPL